MMSQPLGSTNNFWRLLFSGRHILLICSPVHWPPYMALLSCFLLWASPVTWRAVSLPQPSQPSHIYLTRVDGEVIILEYYWK